MNDSEQMVARNEIIDTKSRYALGVDTKRWDLFGSAFTLNATWDEGEYPIARHPDSGEWNPIGSAFSLEELQKFAAVFDWPVVGRQAITDAGRLAMSGVTSFHKLFIPNITFTQDGRANVVWPFEDVLHFPSTAPFSYLNGLGHYLETYVVEEGKWLINDLKLSRTLITIR